MSSYNRTPIMDLVDEFNRFVGFLSSNRIGHVVLQDYNLLDSNIDFQLRWIEQHRLELLDPNDGEQTEDKLQIVIGFLNFLKAIPEEQREWDLNDD